VSESQTTVNDGKFGRIAMKPKGRRWIKVEQSLPEDGQRVDVWFDVWASPLSMGIADSWPEPNCWRENGKWVHMYLGEVTGLAERYITHWLRPDQRKKEAA
jgi:hypothetical protein